MSKATLRQTVSRPAWAAAVGLGLTSEKKPSDSSNQLGLYYRATPPAGEQVWMSQ